MKTLLSAASLTGLLLSTAASSALAQPGCVGRVALPPTESVRHERVLESPGHVERYYVEGRVERIGHRVLVRAGHEERVRLPALYRTWHGSERVAGPVRWERTEPRYETVREQVVVEPGHYVWERRSSPMTSAAAGPGQTMVTPTGEIMCKVWCPARYETVERRVLAERGHSVAIPTFVEREVSHTVMVRPASVEVHRTPAEYRMVYETRVLSRGHWVENRTPARYGWREQHIVHDGGQAWAPVVCGGPLSRPAMAHMQASLNAQGYHAGPSDGLGRAETYDALRRYQMDHHMAAGQVTVESARALGVVQ
jgi:hypothetical protein